MKRLITILAVALAGCNQTFPDDPIRKEVALYVGFVAFPDTWWTMAFQPAVQQFSG